MPAQIATSEDIARIEDKLNVLLKLVAPAPTWIGVAEYAERKGVTTATVYRWIAEGRVEARGTRKCREVKV